MGDLKQQSSSGTEHQVHPKKEAGKLGGVPNERSGTMGQAEGQLKETWGTEKQPDR